jgi:effector-binding domain-containing protein
MSDNTVAIKVVPATLLISYQMTVPANDQVPAYFDVAHKALRVFIKEHGLKVIGPHMTIWHQGPEVMQNEVVEATFPIDREVPGEGEVRVYTLPETLVASYTHRGKFIDFQVAHATLARWIGENGYRAAKGYREIYHHHNPADMDHSVTEVQFPVEKVN